MVVGTAWVEASHPTPVEEKGQTPLDEDPACLLQERQTQELGA